MAWWPPGRSARPSRRPRTRAEVDELEHALDGVRGAGDAEGPAGVEAGLARLEEGAQPGRVHEADPGEVEDHGAVARVGQRRRERGARPPGRARPPRRSRPPRRAARAVLGRCPERGLGRRPSLAGASGAPVALRPRREGVSQGPAWGRLTTPRRLPRGPSGVEECRADSAQLSDAERERLIMEHLPLVRGLARRYAERASRTTTSSRPGTIGLIKAIDRFDPARATSCRAPPSRRSSARSAATSATTSSRPRPARASRRRRRGSPRRRRPRGDRAGRSPSLLRDRRRADLDRSTWSSTPWWPAARTGRADGGARGGDGDEDEGIRPLGEEDPGLTAASAGHAAPGRPRCPRPRALRPAPALRGGAHPVADRRPKVGVSQMHVTRIIRRALERLRESAEGPSGRGRREPRRHDPSGFAL